MSEQADGEGGAPAAGDAQAGKNKMLSTAIFAAIVVGVVAGASYLSSLEPPPDLPADGIHQFKFNTNNDLIGFATPGLRNEAGIKGLDELMQRKRKGLGREAVEKEMNLTCASCHGAPTQALAEHPCHQLNKCIPVSHPPKAECIKCHRHPKK